MTLKPWPRICRKNPRGLFSDNDRGGKGHPSGWLFLLPVRGGAWRVGAWYGSAEHGGVGPGKAWRGAAERGVAGPGEDWRGNHFITHTRET